MLTILLYNTVLITVIELRDGQQAIDNLAACQQDLPEEQWHLCFDWRQAITSTDTAWALGGNASIYAIFRVWNAGQHDNQIRRLMKQTHRLSSEIPNPYVPTIVDNSWVGGLTHRCQELYDDYIAAAARFNDGDLAAEELQLSAKKLFNELSKTYNTLEKPTEFTIKNT